MSRCQKERWPHFPRLETRGGGVPCKDDDAALFTAVSQKKIVVGTELPVNVFLALHEEQLSFCCGALLTDSCYLPFPLQKESFYRIMEEIAAHEEVPLDCVMFLHNEEMVHSYDSPISINLRIADILGTGFCCTALS